MASSSDEGEIVEENVQELKASSLSRAERSGVNRRDRPPSRYSSPDLDSASRHSNSSRRSRSPRGFKRSRDDWDQHPRRDDRGSRQTRPRYNETSGNDYRRSRISYDDVDGPRPIDTDYYDDRRERNRDRDRNQQWHRNGDRDRYNNRQHRNQSRSPVRTQDRFSRGDVTRREGSRQVLQYEDGRGSSRDDTAPRQTFAKSGKVTGQGVASEKTTRLQEQKMPEEDFEEPQYIDEDAEIERRRKRREELLAKSSSATPLLLHAVGAVDKARAASPASLQSGTPQAADSDTPRTPHSNFASPRSPGSHDEPFPGGLDLLDEKYLMNSHGESKEGDDDGPSAADYDPTIDMQEDERRDGLRHGQVVVHGEPHVVETTEHPNEAAHETSEKKLDESAADDDDDFDMFADEFDEDKYTTKPADSLAPAERGGAAPVNGKGGILEGDDKDGYYKFRVGEVMDGRYQIQTTLGKGMFSGVVQAIDLDTKKLVAIKMMRNNDALRKGGYTEIAILQKLNNADAENKKHIVIFERSFDFRGHLCMAFESLSLNLREVLRKFGNNVGINLRATRAYAYQIFVALGHMRKCTIIHADLKPDNILVNENRSILKICDLGTAIDRSDAATAHTEITPYLVSRFYRAPEIILGMEYDYGVDMWSIGCTLYELYTGKILFTGDSNNQMLKSIMEIRGRMTPKLFKRGQLAGNHFNELGQFVSVERDKVLGKTAVRTLPMVKPTRDLRTRLMAASAGMNDTESREMNHFIDLLDHCLALNPDKRLKPLDALKHPFFTSKIGASRR